MAGLEKGMSWAKNKVKSATGVEVGFGHREDGVPLKKHTGKAVLWGTSNSLQDHEHQHIPPMAIRAMEKLHIQESMPIEEVAEMFQLDVDMVRTAVEMRGNFEVVWHEALHFIQPATDPFLGSLTVGVHAPPKHQVRGADDHGFLGEFEIDLSEAATKAETEGSMESTPWRRRIRHLLYRPTGKKKDSEQQTDVFASKESPSNKYPLIPGHECTGVLIELMVEWRRLEAAPCQLTKGQAPKTKEELIRMTNSAGVRFIAE